MGCLVALGLTIGYQEGYKPIIERREQQRLSELKEQRLALEDTLKSEALKDSVLIREITALTSFTEERFGNPGEGGEKREKRLNYIIDSAVTPGGRGRGVSSFEDYVMLEGQYILYGLNGAKEDTLYYGNRNFSDNGMRLKFKNLNSFSVKELPFWLNDIKTEYVRTGFIRNKDTDEALYRLESIVYRLQKIQAKVRDNFDVRKFLINRLHRNMLGHDLLQEPFDLELFENDLKLTRDFAHSYNRDTFTRYSEKNLIWDLYHEAYEIGADVHTFSGISMFRDPMRYIHAGRFLAKDIGYDTAHLEKGKRIIFERRAEFLQRKYMESEIRLLMVQEYVDRAKRIAGE